MLYLMTNHHKSHKWMNLQSRFIKKYTTVEYKVICGVTEIDVGSVKNELKLHSTNVYDISSVENKHYVKMNKMYNILNSFDPSDSDVIVFIDPDAFPIDDSWYEKIINKLQVYPLVAISREENIEPLLDEKFKPYPHPCFLATTYGFWKNNNLSWELNPSRGASCAGVLLKETLDNLGVVWGKMLRTNCWDLHPLMFAVYDDLIFHNGSGNRPAYDSIDVWKREKLSSKHGVSVDLFYPGIIEFNNELSNLVFGFLEKDDQFINYYLRGLP
jgi:hypothetical protein